MAKQTKASPIKSKAAASDDFIPQDATSSGSGRYMKLQQDDNKFRIISKPIFGWLEWIDSKPVRTTLDEEPEGEDEDNKPKKFMAVVVIDRSDEKVKILEVTQQSIIKAIRALTANPDWGNPFSYDINVNKKGESLKTKYAITPSPKKPLGKDVIKEAEKTPCNLEALYEGADPWKTDDGESEYFFK